MTIQDKIAALPPKAGSSGYFPSAAARAERAEAERDLALEVLRSMVKGAEWTTSDNQARQCDCADCDDARALLAACGGESRE